jgi:CRP/FNR family transcriptional regulator, cyclic AMP receptor protein
MNPEELKQIPVLKAMDTEALARLAAALEEKVYADDQTVFAEGDPGDAMYFVVRGHIRVEVRTDAAGTKRKTLTVLGVGEHFGEMSLFDQKPRSASAVAVGPTTLLRLTKSGFDTVMRSNSEAGISVLFGMIRTASDRIRRLSSHLVVYDEIGKAIGESGNLQELLDIVLHQLCVATLADWGLLLLKPQFSEGLELRASEGLALSGPQKEMLTAGKGFLEPLLQQSGDILVEDIEKEEQLKTCSRFGFEGPALLAVPIKLEQQMLGLIALGDHVPGQFELDDLNLVRGVARQAGQAILNALHREEEAARSRHSRQYVRF